jgi:aspartate/glutamate racemase
MKNHNGGIGLNGPLVFVHTVPPLVDIFTRLAAQMLPGVVSKHILDEPLLEMVRQRGRLDEEDVKRLKGHVIMAEAIGARAVLVTCSTISPLVDQVRPAVSFKIEKIDDAMIEAAVTTGQRIGVLATNPTTLAPTHLLLQERSQKLGRDIIISELLIPGALDALLSGDGETHDRLLRSAIAAIGSRVDVVVLAQASMARVMDVMETKERIVKVLSSPYLALERIRTYFTQDKTE